MDILVTKYFVNCYGTRLFIVCMGFIFLLHLLHHFFGQQKNRCSSLSAQKGCLQRFLSQPGIDQLRSPAALILTRLVFPG